MDFAGSRSASPTSFCHQMKLNRSGVRTSNQRVLTVIHRAEQKLVLTCALSPQTLTEMQTMVLQPSIQSMRTSMVVGSLPSSLPRLPRRTLLPNLNHHSTRTLCSSSTHLKPLTSSSSLSFLQTHSLSNDKKEAPVVITKAFSTSGYMDESEKNKLAQVAKRLGNTARYFKRLGSLGFWGQLVCTIVAAGILSFSVVITGKITSPATFYSTAGGIAAAFISVFWSFGYIRLSERLRKTANDPAKAPPRAEVVKSLKNGIILNVLGMGAAVLGMQATVGVLVAKALTSSASPYYQGATPGYSPVLGLDVFLVQASANTILSHFLGLVCSLELLRSVTVPPSEAGPVPRVA